MAMRRAKSPRRHVGAVKRPSHEVKGQIGTDEEAARGAGSPMRYMPPEQKVGYHQLASPL